MASSRNLVVITPENAAQYGFLPEIIAMFEDKLRLIRPRVKNYATRKALELDARQECCHAQYLLGRKYEAGHDIAKAEYWYNRAAEKGHAAAAFALYFELKKKRVQLLHTIFDAVNIRNPLDDQQPFAGYYAGRALELLSAVFLSESEQDRQAAYYQTALYHTVLYALAGDIDAQNLLALMKEKGYGGKKDPDAARKWRNLLRNCNRSICRLS